MVDAAQLSPAAAQRVAALEQVIAQRDSRIAAFRAQQAQSAAADGPSHVLADAADSTTRRLKGLAAALRSAGSLTAAETTLLDTIISGATQAGTGVEPEIVALASQIEYRNQRISQELGRASAAVGQLVGNRQQQLRQWMIQIQTAGAAPSADVLAQARAYNELTNRVGTGLATLQKRGALITPVQAAAIEQAATTALAQGGDPTQLLASIAAASPAA